MHKFFTPIILTFVLLSFQANAFQCISFVKPSYLKNPHVSVFKKPTSFVAIDTSSKFGREDEHFFFRSFYEADGGISINAILRSENTRSQHLDGRVLFDDTIKYFKARGISKINGSWFSYSDNHQAYFKALEMGLPPSDAAMMTWTGQQALRHGYLYASVTLVKDGTEEGYYDGIEVVFSKNKENKSDVVKIVHYIDEGI